MENLSKKNWTEILDIQNPCNQVNNTGESHSNRLEQLKDRILGLGDKKVLKKNQKNS
jgi:hypothetical protein